MENPPAGAAADRAYDAIRAALLQGKHLPGSMLSEAELGAALGMSRTPVRAALLRLQDEGWVRIYPKRGALVRDLTEREVREAAEVRHALESAGVHNSTSAARAAAVDGLVRSVEGQAAALARGDFSGFVDLATRFHRAFVELADNQTMLGVYDRLQDLQQLSIARSAGRIIDDPEAVLAAHRALVADARQGDWVSFAAHLAEHQSRSHGSESR